MKIRQLFLTFLTLTLATGGAHAATGTWVGGASWGQTAGSEWTGVSGPAWGPTNGPNNNAILTLLGPGNIVIAGSTTVYTNGITWLAARTVEQGTAINLSGSNPFLDMRTGESQFWTNLTGSSGFTKTGLGTVRLTAGTKGITGGVTVNQGTLQIEWDNDATRLGSVGTLNSSNTLTLGGGGFTIKGKGGSGIVSAQTLGNLTLNAGGSTISINPNNTVAGSTTLNLGTWTKNAGATLYVDFSSANTGTKALTFTTTPSLDAGGIIGGYATINASSTNGDYGFATVSGSNIVRYAYSGGEILTANFASDLSSGTNYQVVNTGGNFTTLVLSGPSATQTVHSLDMAVGDLNATTAKTLVINSGGLLFSRTGTGQWVKTGDKLAVTSGTPELVVSVLGTIGASIGARIDGGVKDNTAGSVSLIKAGPGTLYMNAAVAANSVVAHTYSGDTVVNQGVLQGLLTIPSGIGKGNLVVNAAGTVSLAVASPGGTRTINGLSNSSVAGGLVNNSNASGTAATTFLDLGNNNATATFSGVISGISIIKSGTGTQTLSGANTYAGTTAVNAGTLLVNNTTGSGTGTGNVTVGANGTLGGTGSISGATTVDGKLAPGTSVGKLSFTGGLTLGALAANSLKFELGAPTTAGVDYDTVATSALEIGTLDFTDFQFTGTPAVGVYTLISSTAAITGSIGTASGAIGGFTGALSISGGDTLVLTVSSGGDTTAPSWIATYPKVSNVTSTSFNALAETDETGSAYFLVLADGATPPTSATVQSTGTAIALTANVEGSSAVTGLTPATSYDVYFVAQDAIPNLQASPVKVDVTTQSTYADWADNYVGFTPTGGGLDFDNDGISNLLEFVLGGSPIANDSPSIQATVSASGTDLVLTFKRSDLSEIAPATTVKAQLSEDLITWNPADDIIIAPGNTGNAGPIGSSNASYTISNSGGMDTVTVTIPKAAATKKFARVIAIQP